MEGCLTPPGSYLLSPLSSLLTRSFLESALLTACPGFETPWQALARTYPPDAPPGADDFLGHLAAHVHRSLSDGRIAEVKRLFMAVERLLGEADPILEELLERALLARLAADVRDSALDERLVLPHLGPRARAVWARAQPAG